MVVLPAPESPVIHKVTPFCPSTLKRFSEPMRQDLSAASDEHSMILRMGLLSILSRCRAATSASGAAAEHCERGETRPRDRCVSDGLASPSKMWELRRAGACLRAIAIACWTRGRRWALFTRWTCWALRGIGAFWAYRTTLHSPLDSLGHDLICIRWCEGRAGRATCRSSAST